MAHKPAMPRRPLGRTGLELSALGFGASPLGGVFQSIDEGQGVAAVHAAFAAGINYFDTSPFYGITKSEQVLGRGLKDLPRSEYILSTKVGRYGQEEFDFSAARVNTSVTESLDRLQVGHIDILLCHDVEFGDLDQIVNETLPALSSLKAKGLISHIGFSALPLPIITHILDRVTPGTVDVVLSYCHNSMNDSTVTTLVPYLQEKGVGLIGASPMSMGLLTHQGPPTWHPAPPEVQLACSSAAALAKERGVDISKLALQHSLRLPGLSSTLVGMAAPNMVANNVAAALEALDVVPATDRALEDEVAREVAELLSPIHGVSWPSGKNHGV